MSGGCAVVLFAYDRPDHTRRVLESLDRDGVGALTVYSDGPAAPDDVAAVQAVRQVVRSHAGPRARIVEREDNLGLARSIIQGVSQALERADRVIVLEDDCVALPGFLDYMGRALERYAGDDAVGCISGYGPPGVRRPPGYDADGYFTRRVSSWGWGTWRSAWSLLREDWDALRDEVARSGGDLASDGIDLDHWLEPEFGRQVGRDAWTPLWLFPLLLAGKRTLWPFRSYVMNIGLDGTGVHPRQARLSLGAAPVSPDGFRFPDPGRATPDRVLRQFAVSIARPGTRPLRHRLRDRLRRIPPLWSAYKGIRRVLRLT